MAFIEDFQGLLPLFTGFILIALAVFVYRTARGQSFNKAFSALYFLSGIKSLCDAFSTTLGQSLHAKAVEFPAPSFWIQVAAVCASLMLPLFVLFVLLFPRPVQLLSRRPALGGLIFAPSIVLIYQFLYLFHNDLPGFVKFSEQFAYLTILITFGCMALLGVSYARTTDAIERTRSLYVLAAFAILVLVNLVVVAWNLVSPDVLFFRFYYWVAPIFEIGVACLIGYAIVKYQLLGVELKVKVGAKYVLVFSILVIGFFIANNTFQKVVEPIFGFTDYSYLLSALAATIVFQPIQKGAGTLVNKMFPDTTQPKAIYLNKRGQDIYHAQVAYILRDGEISERERRFLDNLRNELAIRQEDAQRIEQGLRLQFARETLPPVVASPAKPTHGSRPRPMATKATSRKPAARPTTRAKPTGKKT